MLGRGGMTRWRYSFLASGAALSGISLPLEKWRPVSASVAGIIGARQSAPGGELTASHRSVAIVAKSRAPRRQSAAAWQASRRSVSSRLKVLFGHRAINAMSID